MRTVITASDLSSREKWLLFWASFLSLTAAGFGFAFRVAMQGEYRAEFSLTQQEVGQVFGAALWPIAITMIGFSLVVDRTGYKIPMLAAFVLQAASGVGTYMAQSYELLYISALCAGLGHGIVEAVINPVCAAVYPKAKTKWLTWLHAAWPAGLVLGTLIIIATEGSISDWRAHALWIVIPAVAYAIMYLPCRFPIDERVRAGVPFMDMLRQVGFLGAALAGFMLIYEIGNQTFALTTLDAPDQWFLISLGAGVALGAAYGAMVGSIGKPLFFLLCLVMIPVATAELGTDGWIKDLMTPVLEGLNINAAFALVFSAFIMLLFRVFAGGILKLFSPPVILCLSGVFSAIGLYWLSGATGAAIFVAFVLYAIGQTYYWPCVLGFVSERFPEGGALTLNTVSAIGLLSAGIFAFPILGAKFDSSTHDAAVAQMPALVEAAETDGTFMWMTHKKVDPTGADAYFNTLGDENAGAARTEFEAISAEQGRNVLKFAAIFPAILIAVFGAVALYFKSIGGYKPIELTDAT